VLDVLTLWRSRFYLKQGVVCWAQVPSPAAVGANQRNRTNASAVKRVVIPFLVIFSSFASGLLFFTVTRQWQAASDVVRKYSKLLPGKHPLVRGPP
jgi:hypothetical protein